VVLNLGSTPYPGKYLGLSLEDRYRGAFTTDIGDFHMFVRLTDPEKELLSKGASSFKEKISSLDLEFLLESPDLILEVVENLGKYAGMFYSKTKKIQKERIKLARSKTLTGDTGLAVEYLLAHEFGHLLDHHYISTSAKARTAWINAYKASTEATVIEQEELDSIFSTITSSEGLACNNVRELCGLLDAEDTTKFKYVVKWIKASRQISLKDLNSLVESSDENNILIEDLWPAHPIAVKTLKPVLTEYATVSTQELFAETFAHYVCGSKLPKNLTALIEKSIRFAKQQASAAG
jgi:hypothetical protein